jgi:hypothetical protein
METNRSPHAVNMRTLRHPEDIPPSVFDASQLTIQLSPLKALNTRLTWIGARLAFQCNRRTEWGNAAVVSIPCIK